MSKDEKKIAVKTDLGYVSSTPPQIKSEEKGYISTKPPVTKPLPKKGA